MDPLFIAIISISVIAIIAFMADSTDSKNALVKRKKNYDASKHLSPHDKEAQLKATNSTYNDNLRRKKQAYLFFEKERLLQEQITSNKDDFIFCDIVGISYRPPKTIKRAKELYKGEYLFLEEEPENLYDKNAIKVITDDNSFIGYIPAFLCTDVKEFIKKHPDYDVIVTRVYDSSRAPFVDICIKY